MNNKNTENKNIFSFQYTVPKEDIDELNHVNNVVYLQWVQNAAIKHWNQLTEKQKFDDYVWVVARHEIDYIRPAFLGDEITIQTWVGETFDSTSIRWVEVYKNDKIITKTRTTWRLLNAKTLKPTDIPEEMYKILKIE